MTPLTKAGPLIDAQLATIERSLNPVKAALLGVGLAIGVIAGGIAACLLVLLLLVQLFA